MPLLGPIHLALDFFSHSLFKAGRGLGSQATNHFLGILEHVQSLYFAPSQSNHMEATVEVRIITIH